MIPTILPITSVIVILVLLAVVASSLVRRYLKLRGPRVVTCPADNSQAAVSADAVRGALSVVDTHGLHLKSCSHWPDRQSCGQECLKQIEASPNGCLVLNILAGWYSDKSCTLCGKPFGTIDWLEHKPGLMDQRNVTKDWSQIHTQDLYQTLETHAPVCWNCHIAMTFRREYPELVTDRPWKRQ